MATARKLPSGNYRCLVFVGKSDDCKSGYKSFTAPTKKEAEKMAANLEEVIKNERNGKTVGSVVDDYIKAKYNILSPSTIAGYKRIRKVWAPKIDRIQALKTDKKYWQFLFNEKSASLSPKSLSNALSLFSAAFNFHEIPMPKITLPQKEKKEREIPTTEQIQLMIDAAEGEFKLAIMLAAEMGFSRSEICALTKDDCKDGNISISKAMVQNDKKEWVIKVPKEYARYRTIPMPDNIKAEIEKVKEGRPLVSLNPNVIGNRFDRMCDKLFSRRFGFHSLRHYNVSAMLALGIPPKYIITRTGHSTMNMVERVYGHAIISEQERYANQISDFINSKNTTRNTTRK